MKDPREVMPLHIADGVIVRQDGSAIGLVGGGAPSWDLLSFAGRVQVQADYHRLLCSLQAPIDMYIVDAPTSLADEVVTFLQAQDRATNGTQAQILGELADELTMIGDGQGSRAKQVIWAITHQMGTPRPTADMASLSGLLRPRSHAKPVQTGVTAPMAQSIAAARSAALRWAEALRSLGGVPTPRLLVAEEIARLVYQLADPIRAQRYPLSGNILARVRRAITVELPS